MLERLSKVINAGWLGGVTGQIMDAGHHGPDVAESVERIAGLPGQIDALLTIELSFNEPIQLLSAHQRKIAKFLAC